MNERRKESVTKAFRVFDKDGSGIMDYSNIKSTYNAKKHPDVLSGLKTEDDIHMEYLDTFLAAYTHKHGNMKTKDRKVS